MQHFDVVVIGREVAGLAAGALLAKSGQRVLHIDPNPTRQSYKYKDLTFFRALNLFSAWDGSPAQKRVLFDLNLISDLSKRLVAADPALQIVLPDHRIDIRRDAGALAAEIEREWPGNGEPTAASLERITKQNEQLDKILDGRAPITVDSWGERRRLKKYLAEHPMPEGADLFADAAGPHPLARVTSYTARFWSALSGAAAGATTLRAAQRLIDGLYVLPNGLDDITDRLIGVIRNFHGASREDDVEDVTTAWRRGIVSIKLKGGEVIGCDHVVGAEPAARLFARLPERLMSRGYAKQLADITPKHRVYTLNVAMKPEGIPEAMGQLGLFVRDPARAVAEDNLLLWCQASAGKELRAMTVAAIVEDADSRDRVYWRAIKERILVALEELMPFYREHLEHVDVPWDDGEQPNPRPTSEMAPLYQFEGESTLGLTALPHETPVKNVFLANRQVLPALGLEGEFLTGIAVARLLRSAKDEPSWAEH